MNNYFDYKIELDGICLKYSNSPKIEEREMHTYHEILYCDEREAVLHTENARTKIQRKNIVIIPKGTYHLFDLSGASKFTRIKISLSDELLKALPISIFSDGVYAVSLSTHRCAPIMERLVAILCENEEEKNKFLLYSLVMLLLAELDASKLKNAPSDSHSNNTLILSVVDYVTKNLSEDLSIPKIAKATNTSPSFLTHKFQKEVGISLHRYIVGKRMTRARELIDSNERPTKIYTDCGFCDYSSFYKAYLSFFGTAPSKKKNSK